MDETEDGARYPPNSYGGNHQQASGSTQQPKLAVYNIDDDDDIDGDDGDHDDDDIDGDDNSEDEEDNNGEEEEEANVENGSTEGLRKDDEDDSDDVVDDDDGDDDDENVNGEDGKKNCYRRPDDDDLERHPKKRKLKNLISSYEFAPRIVAPSTATASVPKLGGRNSLTDWTEHETFVLLDAWGDKFLQLGRKSLRSEEWHEVSEKVSQESKMHRTDTQCRNRLDTLKKKYKKEKMKLGSTRRGNSSKWVYFKKMDVLMSSSPKQSGLSCGFDSGEYVFMSPNVYLNRSNGLDEMRDSPGHSETSADKEDDSDGLPPKRASSKRDMGDGSSFRLLADSIQKFSKIYEKIENSKRQQMVELEKMRMDFHRELELKKRQILEKAQAEIAKIHRGDDDEDNDLSAENGSG